MTEGGVDDPPVVLEESVELNKTTEWTQTTWIQHKLQRFIVLAFSPLAEPELRVVT